MCMIDDCDGPFDVYLSEERQARKQWLCDECGAPIPPGTAYRYAKGLFDGRWEQYHTCLVCYTGPCAWLIEQCGGFLHHGVQEDLGEHWHELAGLQTPAERRRLGRLIVEMRRRRNASHARVES